MILLDPPTLQALAAVLASAALVIWAVRRKR